MVGCWGLGGDLGEAGEEIVGEGLLGGWGWVVRRQGGLEVGVGVLELLLGVVSPVGI